MKILIVDDHILFREGLAGLLRSQPDMQVIGECGSVQEAIETVETARPEVILMDFTLPDGTGLDATRAILNILPDVQIIFLTVHDNDERLISAMRSGAKGYLLKNLSVNKLLASLRALERTARGPSNPLCCRTADRQAARSSCHSRTVITNCGRVCAVRSCPATCARFSALVPKRMVIARSSVAVLPRRGSGSWLR